jgi:rhamnosyltransferase
MNGSAAVIVTYHPDAQVFERIDTLAAQVDVLYVIDNTPETVAFPALAPGVVFERNGNRGGLAGALNSALRHARASHLRYVFVFDQDTEIPRGYCDAMLAASATLAATDWAVAGPRHVNASTGHPVRLSVPGRFMNSLWPTSAMKNVECLFLINSCSLLDLARVPAQLCYDEHLAVDMIDVAFCLALRRLGLQSFCIPSITVVHGIGNRKPGSFAFSATHYSSERKYLQTRNRFIVWRTFWATEKAYVVTDLLIWLMDAARTIVFEARRGEKLGAIGRGIIDGLRFRIQPKSQAAG